MCPTGVRTLLGRIVESAANNRLTDWSPPPDALLRYA